MKKIILILILLLLTGCQDYTEINDFAIISGIILDYKENKLEMISELIINEEETKIKTFKTEGQTIDECLSKISEQSNKDIFISHLKTLILTENIIQNNINIYDYFLRSSKSKMNFNIYTINSKDKDKLFNIYENESSSMYIEKIKEYNNKIYSSSTPLTFIDLVYKNQEPGLDPLYPQLTLSNNEIFLSNLTFFTNKQINLSTKNTINYNMLINNIDKTILNLKCNENDYTLLTKDIKTEKNYDKNKNLFTFNITIKANVNNYKCDYNLNKEKTIKKLNKISSEQIKKDIEELIHIEIQNNYDFLGINNYIEKHHKTKVNLKDLKLKINVKTEITSIGEMRK